LIKIEAKCVISEERRVFFRNVKVVLLKMTKKWQYKLEKSERIWPNRGFVHQITHTSTLVLK